MISIIGLFAIIIHFAIKSDHKVKNTPKQNKYEDLSDYYAEQNDSGLCRANSKEPIDDNRILGLSKIIDTEEYGDDEMPKDQNFITSSEMTVMDYMNWLDTNKELESKANEHREQGKLDDEMLVCMLALTKLEQLSLSKEIYDRYESYWRDRFDLLEKKRVEVTKEITVPVSSCSIPELPPMYGRTDTQYQLFHREIDFIDRFIFQAKRKFQSDSEFLPIKHIQGLCGLYQKSGNEQSVFDYLTESISEEIKNPTLEQSRKANEVALSIVTMLQKGCEYNEIFENVKETLHLLRHSPDVQTYSVVMNARFRNMEQAAKIQGDISEERRICQEALNAIDKCGGSGYRKYWEDRLHSLSMPENETFHRLEAFGIKSFKKISDPYTQKVVSQICVLCKVYSRSEEPDKDIFQFFIEKADSRINTTASEDIKNTFIDLKRLVHKLQETEDDEAVIAWAEENIVKSSINYAETERKVVEWPHTYVFGADELNNATPEQRAFYLYFKEQFLAGKFLDLEDNSNYAFVLMFDLADHCTNESQLEELENKLDILGEHYPKTQRYIPQNIDKVKDRFLAQHSNELLNKIEKGEECNTRWVKEGETVVVAGMKLTRGNFYLGNYLSVPKGNGRGYTYGAKKVNFLGPVVNPDLEARYVENASWASFSSYSTMTNAMRFKYLSFLSGDVSCEQIEPAFLCLYVMGIEYRLFVDKETTASEKESLLMSLIKLFPNNKVVYDVYGSVDILSNLLDRALCNLMPTDYKNLIGDYPVVRLKNYSRFLLNEYAEGKKKIPYDKAFDFAYKYFGVMNGIPEIEENIEAVRKRFIEHMQSNESYYSYEPYQGNNNISIVERLGDYSYNFHLFRHESCDITYSVKYPKTQVPDNMIWVIVNASNRIRSDSWKHWELLRENNGVPTAYADMNFASYINPASLPTLIKLASDIDALMDTDGYALIEVNELVKWIKYPPRKENGIYKSYAQVIVEALGKMGYGIAPNPNIEGDRLMYGAYCCLYRLLGNNEVSNDALKGQAVVKMAAQVAMADKISSNDIHLIESGLASLGFDGNTLKYEAAYARVYSSSKQNFYNSKVIQEFSESEIAAIYKLLLRMTFNGGDVSTERVKILKRYCKYLGQDPEKIHSGIHEAMTTDEFATVEKTTGAIRYAIPEPGAVKHKFAIDIGKLERMERQTEQAQAMLSDIFVDEEQPKVKTHQTGGIDSVIEILSKLLEKEVWQLAEVDELCKAKGLMTGFVLEKINDLSYEKVDDAVIDQDGAQVYVTIDYKEKLI